MARKSPNWIDAFMDYTQNLPSPELFRKWCAISAVAGALERKVWVYSMGSNLYPTLYVILVAPPGVGKTVVTSEVDSLWKELPDQYTASTSVSKASLIDDLRDAERTIVRPKETPSTVSFNSIKVLVNELQVLIPAYENEFMGVMTDLYDGRGYSERKRTKDLNFSIPAPQISMLGGTTPSYLNNLLPDGAWDQGFLSRTLLIYAGTRVLVNPFADLETSAPLRKRLSKDLQHIGNLYGRMRLTEEAATAYVEWYMAGGPPTPDHPKLHHYLTRRGAHLLKLCMVASVAESDDLTITLEHYQTALSWLIEMEHYIPDIFKSMTSGGDGKVIEETWYFAYKLYARDKEPIPEHKIQMFVQQRVPAHSVDHIIRVMVKSGLFKEMSVNKIGTCYQPMEKREL
jgi:hypothetical protein